MPAHIYYRIGRYNDAVLANVRAADVDEAYIEACNAQGFYPALYYPHNIHFLWSAATMQGQKDLSIQSARRVVDNVRVEQVQQFPTIEFLGQFLFCLWFGLVSGIRSWPSLHLIQT